MWILGLKGFFIDTRWNLFEELGPSSRSRPKSVAAFNQYFCLKKKTKTKTKQKQAVCVIPQRI